MPINPIVARESDGSWTFTWPVGTPPYAVWLNGELFDTVAVETIAYNFGDYVDTPPPLEILNDGEASENEQVPPTVVLQWRGIQTSGGYAVEQFLSGSWVEIGQVMETQRGYYYWQTDELDDNVSHLFRVIALSPDSQEGVPLAFTIEMVRNPAPPVVALGFTSAGDVEVS